MEIKNARLSDIKPYEKNPRKNDEAVDYVANSIKEFGFKQPIVVDKNGVIIAGHTRYKAAKKLGLKTVPVVYAEDLNDEQVRAYRLADNKTGEKAFWDFDLLGEELDNILSFDMEDFGFDLDEGEPNPYDIPESEKGSLEEVYVVPPFSVLDTRQGYWKTRQKQWNDMILDSGQGRDKVKVIASTFGKKFNDASILDPVLAEIMCRWFTPQPKGNKCFDVFAGDTAFGFVSSYLGNEFNGIELRQEQADFNQHRIDAFGLNAHYHCDDGRNVLDHLQPESQDLLFSCPPYFDLEVYSDKENDASNQGSYEEFYAILDEAFKKAAVCLKENRFAVIVITEIRSRKNGAYYDFTGDVKRTFKEAGFCLYNDLVLINAAGSAAMRAANWMKTRKMIRTHQNVLVFYKGNPKKIKDHFPVIEEYKDGALFYESENE